MAAAVLASANIVQATQDQPQGQPAAQAAPHPPARASSPQQGIPPEVMGRPMRNYPPPTNLKVLPKDLTGREVREIMEKWAGSLGAHCDTCHVADPNHPGPNGRPRLNFPDDSKPDKQIARIMYTMTQQINTDYISKAMDMDKDEEGSPVTCGTCHRGHKMPEEFVIPKEERPGGPGAGEGGPPAGAMPFEPGSAPPPSN
jgi:hypothetical protein